MDHLLLSLFATLLLASRADEITFGQNYYFTWGFNHATVLDQGKEVQLLIDQYSGSGFASIHDYGSGFFQMRMKIPNKKSKGVLTTFYLTSKPVNQEAAYHDELDFEFTGNNSMPYTLSTNVITNGVAGREQQFQLWFDPTTDFHTYAILWNQHQIVFFVDDTPIRVFKNYSHSGVNYPSQSMHIEASIWNSTNWLGPVDWSQGPFRAFYQKFDIDGCLYRDLNPQQCYSNTPTNFWNAEKYWQLDPDQQRKYEDVSKKYMSYDYCSKYNESYLECSLNS
ncbi:hypothetical protein RJ640_019506 [Escallonia rubra]|uniref:Xyloglucan endotransglucosylase/hydrolase n=1 Tax=Escallonia rubra TaxID=112253 RepID=A0AA88R4C9_9ASTE|nr:hypothetical protein RJ640_019506 [Escallonia rubra]